MTRKRIIIGDRTPVFQKDVRESIKLTANFSPTLSKRKRKNRSSYVVCRVDAISYHPNGEYFKIHPMERIMGSVHVPYILVPRNPVNFEVVNTIDNIFNEAPDMRINIKIHNVKRKVRRASRISLVY
eukprot:TRINITY_DN6127_c0_g1_i1.p1 TRINITY_DN6127_c0_g1~~TRINITY_DN6127_c0_g1_i1.p1  ORF type:complete len:127 (-),score=17.45 TRINITY_DN6127_c0_g1_i1:68-448(-)